MILHILGFAALANLLVDFITQLDTSDRVPTKPFKCDKCLAYWISVIPFMVMHGFEGILLAAITSMVSALIFKYSN